MYSTPEQFTRTATIGVETFVFLANTTFGGAERLAALNLNAARTLLEKSITTTRSLIAAKDMNDLVSVQVEMSKPDLTGAGTYSRSVYKIAAETQEAVSGILEARLDEFAKSSRTVFSKA